MICPFCPFVPSIETNKRDQEGDYPIRGGFPEKEVEVEDIRT